MAYCCLLFFLLYTISAWPIIRSQFDMLNIVVPYSTVRRFGSYNCWLVPLSFFTLEAGLYNRTELVELVLVVSSQLLLLCLIIWLYATIVISCSSALKWRQPVLTLWYEALEDLCDIDDKTRECILDLIESEFHGRELARSSRLSSGLLKPAMSTPYITNININGFKSSLGARKTLWSKTISASSQALIRFLPR